MALIDFYQLAVLHKLSRCDGGILSNRSHPPPMPTTTPSSSRSPPDQPDQTTLSTSPSAQCVPKAPESKQDATHSARESTPVSVGTAIFQKLNPETDQAPKYDSAKYEEYIAQDFERHRVFVDIDVFMKSVLHVPENWKRLWGQTIRQIRNNKAFLIAYTDYSRECETRGGQEQRFYKPLVDMTNAILDFSTGLSSDDSVKPRTPQRYLRNDPRNILHGVMNDLSPDIVAVHSGFLPHILPGEKAERRLNESNLTWAQPLQVLEVKPWDNALVDGSCMPRLKVNGERATTSRNGFS
jgi:hypothetical protein